jgi:hypothetical protein
LSLLDRSDIAITAKFYADTTVEDVRAAMETTAVASKPAAPAKEVEGE